MSPWKFQTQRGEEQEVGLLGPLLLVTNLSKSGIPWPPFTCCKFVQGARMLELKRRQKAEVRGVWATSKPTIFWELCISNTPILSIQKHSCWHIGCRGMGDWGATSKPHIFGPTTPHTLQTTIIDPFPESYRFGVLFPVTSMPPRYPCCPGLQDPLMSIRSNLELDPFDNPPCDPPHLGLSHATA